jgi:hypothetical protein
MTYKVPLFDENGFYPFHEIYFNFINNSYDYFNSNALKEQMDKFKIMSVVDKTLDIESHYLFFETEQDYLHFLLVWG